MRFQWLTNLSPPLKMKNVLRRVRLSASPATGLVGMEESSFLGSFFDCLGFLPLTNERCGAGV